MTLYRGYGRYRLRRKLDGRIVAFTNYIIQADAEWRFYGLDTHEIINRYDEVISPKRNYFIHNHKTGRSEQR